MKILATYILFTVIGFIMGAFVVAYYSTEDEPKREPKKPVEIKKQTDVKIHSINKLSNREIDSLLTDWRRQHGDTNAVNN